MKKGLLLLTSVLFLTACNEEGDSLFSETPENESPSDEQTEPPRFSERNSALTITTDNVTGCKYITHSLNGGITPLMLPDGTQDCGGE